MTTIEDLEKNLFIQIISGTESTHLPYLAARKD